MLKPLLLVFIATASSGIAQIYADFQTSMGDFSCELKYAESPQAVANFIGLAEGSRPWIDPATGAVRVGVAYYTGVKFHRVIAGFMNQSGSRNGLGTDGPGYTFRDELANGLTHSAAGILSMANPGQPNTNGAQFFITVAATSWLNGVHTIFGNVTAGLGVVMAINAVPKTTDSGGELSVPVTPVVIQNIAIRRIGTAASAFDIHAQKLPVCGGVKGSLRVIPGVQVGYVMAAPQPAATGLQAFRSTDLQTWTRLGEIYQGTGSTGADEITFEDSNIATKAFYNVPLVHYPDALGPAATANRTLAVLFGNQSLTYQFNAQGNGGTFQYNDGTSISNHTIDQVTFHSDLWSATWDIYSSNFPGIRINAALVSSTPTLIQGSMSLAIWNVWYWNPYAIGTMSLTK